MRIFVAGATGAIGRQLVPMLVDAGHAVVGTTRSLERGELLASMGAVVAVLDAHDQDAVRRAMVDASPDVVIHQLTDLAGGFGPEDLARNSRLREIGTRNLVDGALAADARRLVAQSGAWLYAEGPLPHDETHPLRTPTPEPKDASLRAVIELERLVTETPDLDGVVLRYGYFYGPAPPGSPGRRRCRRSRWSRRRGRQRSPSTTARPASTTWWTTRKRSRTGGRDSCSTGDPEGSGTAQIRSSRHP